MLINPTLEKLQALKLTGMLEALDEQLSSPDIGSGLNLLYRMDIDSKFNFIDQQANDNIVHSFKF